jgi:hypothetical protein
MQFPRLKTYGKAIYQSFYHPPLYRDVIWIWKGFGGQYLMVLSVLLGAMMAVMVAISSMQFEKHRLPQILAQIPQMQIKDGILIVQAPQPVKVSVQEKNGTSQLLAYIDTEVPEQKLNEQKGVAQIIVGSDHMLVRGKNGYMRSSFAKMSNMNIDPIEIQKGWPSPITVFVFSLLFMSIGLFLNMLILAVVIAVCSYLVTAFMRQEYSFETRVKIAAIAMTPAMLLSKLLIVAADHATETWFDILLSVFYVYVMIVSSRKLQPAPHA